MFGRGKAEANTSEDPTERAAQTRRRKPTRLKSTAIHSLPRAARASISPIVKRTLTIEQPGSSFW